MATEDQASSAELTLANPAQESDTAMDPPAVTTDDTTTITTAATATVVPATVLADNRLQSLDLFNENTVQQLCDGFLHIFQPELLRVQDSLRELT